MLDRTELVARLTLRALPGLRDRAINRLIAGHGSADRVLEQTSLVTDMGARMLPDKAVMARVQTCLDTIDRLGITVLTPDAPQYPSRLKTRLKSAAPSMLFALGDVGLLDNAGVAIVGSRAMSDYGRRVAEDLALALSGRGLSVISGLALGIDGVAHAGALRARGETIAVVGNGVDVAYPAANRALRNAIIRRGVVVSQFLPGDRPAPHHFPERNVILAALSEGVLVIEAGARSGATITAKHTNDFSIPSMAVPGPIGQPGSIGTNRLILDGSTMITCPQDVIDAMSRTARADMLVAQLEAREVRRVAAQAAGAVHELDEHDEHDEHDGHDGHDEHDGHDGHDGHGAADDAHFIDEPESSEEFALRNALAEPRLLDELVGITALPAAAVMSMLLRMEMSGVVAQDPGSRYSLRTPFTVVG